MALSLGSPISDVPEACVPVIFVMFPVLVKISGKIKIIMEKIGVKEFYMNIDQSCRCYLGILIKLKHVKLGKKTLLVDFLVLLSFIYPFSDTSDVFSYTYKYKITIMRRPRSGWRRLKIANFAPVLSLKIHVPSLRVILSIPILISGSEFHDLVHSLPFCYIIPSMGQSSG